MIEISPHTVAQLLYLVHSDPEELQEALGELRAPDIAEALKELPPDAAAKVMASLPFDLAVHVFDEPELTRHRCAIIQRIDPRRVGPLIEAMSSDQQADLFREVPHEERSRLLATVSESTRSTLRKLLKYPPETAGGIMTSEFVSVPSDWTVGRALMLISEVGGRKETVYAIYIVDPSTQELVHVVSLRELLTAHRDDNVLDVGRRRPPLTVTADIDREEAARLISKYNLLAIPVIDDQRLLLGGILGVIGFVRIVLSQNIHIFTYGPHYMLLAITVGFALVGIVAFGSLAGSMLPFLLKRIGFDPASASAPFVATLVDVTGLVIYFSVAFLVLHGTLL